MDILTEKQKIIKLTLIRLGIKCDLIGFTYLAKSVELVIDQPMLVYHLKKLFAQVAQDCGANSAFRVEANIQNAITLTYNTKGFDIVNKMFGMEIFEPNYKPTTAETIKLVAEYYQMGLYKNAI
jgi:hypothetical protein